MASNPELSYSDWLQQNQGLVDNALAQHTAQRAPIAAPTAPATQPAPTTPVPAPQASPTPGATTVTVQTAPQPATAPAPPPVPSAPVAAPATRNPKAALGQLRQEQVASANSMADSIKREGEAKVTGAEKNAEIIGQATERARQYTAAAEETHDGNLAERKQVKEWIAQDMRKLREAPVEPERWKKAIGVVGQILGATAIGYAGPVGQGFALGMNALNDWVNKESDELAQEQAQAEANMQRSSAYADFLEKDSANEVEYAHKLVANNWFIASQELQKQGELSKVPEYRELAFRMSEEAKDKGRNVLIQGYQTQINEQKAAAAGRAAAAERARKQRIEELKLQMEGAKTQAEINKLNAEAAKLGGQATGGQAPAGREVTNPRLFAGADDKQRRDFETDEVTTQELLRKVDELDGLLAQHGTEAEWGSNSRVASRMNVLATDIKLGLKDQKKLGTWDAGSALVLSDLVGDPNAYFTSGGNMREKLAVIREGTIAQQNRSAEQLGLAPRWTQNEPAARPDIQARTADNRIKVFNPNTGDSRLIPPERLTDAEGAGYIAMADYSAFTADHRTFRPAPRPAAAQPARPNPVEDLSQAEYEARVRAEAGY